MTCRSESRRSGVRLPRGEARAPSAHAGLVTGGLVLLLMSSALEGTATRGRAQELPPAEREPREVVVQAGDTLWGIAERVLGDPRRWPEIMAANRRKVESPGRLVPGTVLRIPGEGRAADAGWSGPGGRAYDHPDGPPRADTVPRPGASLFAEPAAGSFRPGEVGVSGEAELVPVPPGDFASAPFLVHPDSMRGRGRTLSRLNGPESDREMGRLIRAHERVLVSLGGWPAEPGELYQALQWGRELQGHGVVAWPVAVLEIVSIRGDRAEARVRARYGAYRVGDPVAPLPPFPELGDTRLEAVEEGPTMELLGFGKRRPLMAPGSRVFLSSRAESGLRAGDELEVVPGPSGERGRGNGGSDARPVARLRVLRITGGTATASVLRLRAPRLREGARARLVARRVSAEGAEGGGI